MEAGHSSNPNFKQFIEVIQDKKQIACAYHELSQNTNRLQKELVSVNGVVGSDDSSNVGKTLIKAGTCLIAFPEPVISDIVGTALVVTGFTLNRLGRKDNVRELYKEQQKNMRDMQRLQREVCQITLLR